MRQQINHLNWVEINNKSRGRYDNSNIKFKTSMTGSYLCDYSDTYIIVKGTITVPNTAVRAVAVIILIKSKI